MITSVLARQWRRTGRKQLDEKYRPAPRGIARAVCVAAATGVALTTAGLAGAATPAMAATQSLSPPVYTNWAAGYQAQGRWFRFVSTTLTVAPRKVPNPHQGTNGAAVLMLGYMGGEAELTVNPGGGANSVSWLHTYGGTGSFGLSPQVGDRLTVSIYYDRHGHTTFTAADITQGVTRTHRLTVGSKVYTKAWLVAQADPEVTPPAQDTRLWQFTGSRLTTYTGVHGTVLGPWQTSKDIETTTGTSASSVVMSPSTLRNGGQNFGVWLRALPLVYTQAFAGYQDSRGPFRFIATTMTVPGPQVPTGNGGSAFVSLGHNGGATPRPYANIMVLPGGGAGSISYTSNAASGTFTLRPNTGDQLSVSIYYDRQGHYFFTAADTTQGTTQTVKVNAVYADQMPLNSAEVLGMIDNSAVTPPPADIRLWEFTASRVTTYNGGKGTILGPWVTSEWINTTDASATGATVISPSVLSDGGRNFSVWLRHR
jgi:hypothetical protein